jgi:hypothetical protein
MVRRPRIRRALIAALTTALLLPAAAGNASAIPRVPPRVCDYDWQRGPWQIKQLIRCAATRWDSPGTPAYAIDVARCESELRPAAQSNGYAGLFQQALRYWPGRADRWGQPGRSAFNGRANVIVSIRMAASTGSWSAWAGCG